MGVGMWVCEGSGVAWGVVKARGFGQLGGRWVPTTSARPPSPAPQATQPTVPLHIGRLFCEGPEVGGLPVARAAQAGGGWAEPGT